MTYKGIVKEGVVVFKSRAPFREGTRVRVARDAAKAVAVRGNGRKAAKGPGRPRKRPAFHPVGAWDGPPGEFDRLLTEVQQMREQDLSVERSGEDGTLSS